MRGGRGASPPGTLSRAPAPSASADLPWATLVRLHKQPAAPHWLNGRVALTEKGRAKLTESRRLWKEAQRRFEAAYGAERAAALRRSLADIFSEEFALAFSRG